VFCRRLKGHAAFAGASELFIDEAAQKRIAEQLGEAFYDYYRFRASASEFTSWRNSLSALASQLRYSNVRDRGVALEMQLPLSSARLDAFVFGTSPAGVDSAVLVELKQWTDVRDSDFDECVETYLGGAVRKVPHPCVQARSYALADEAHRIRATSNHRFTKKHRKSERAQIDEIVDAAKVSVFFIDDHQGVRADEVGSTTLICETAVRHDARFETIDLRTQFRCAGSDEYIDWIDQLLEVRKTGVTTFAKNNFDVTLYDSPKDLEASILRLQREGYGARLTAGYCWPWSDPDAAGNLIDDIVVGEFHRPWNAKPDAPKLAGGIPAAQFWASDPKGIGQVGCVYTAQSFEFDYAGVIWGPDLVIRGGTWIGQTSGSRDHVVKTRSCARFTDIVKNAYRVLLTRGLRGCHVCILDAETRRYVAARLVCGVSRQPSRRR